LEAPSLTTGDTPANHVLVVDDERRIRDVIIRALEMDGIHADGAADVDGALTRLSNSAYDLVILDLVMPGRDGFAALEELRHRTPGQAVLVLSCLSETSVKVRSLNFGADDYLTKPFHVNELLARVHARLRAVHQRGPVVMTRGGLTLDLVRHRAEVEHREVQLSEREFQVLCELLRHSGRTVAKQYLLSHVWGYRPEDCANVSNVVDACVRRLRAHLGADVIETVRGEGYRVA
jgi:DNA-binding response OmpR family regulator